MAMTIDEMIERLTELRDEGKGLYSLCDTHGYPVINVVVSDVDEESELERAYIESVF